MHRIDDWVDDRLDGGVFTASGSAVQNAVPILEESLMIDDVCDAANDAGIRSTMDCWIVP